MIKNFEIKYESILEAKAKDLTNKPSTHIEEEKKAETAQNKQTEDYCLDRKNSNRLLKGAKIVLFAVGLSLLNSIQAEAQDVNEEIKKEEISHLNPASIVGNIYIGGCILVSIGVGYYIKNLKKRNKDQSYDIKLSDDTRIDEKEATKHIKIICK